MNKHQSRFLIYVCDTVIIMYAATQFFSSGKHSWIPPRQNFGHAPAPRHFVPWQLCVTSYFDTHAREFLTFTLKTTLSSPLRRPITAAMTSPPNPVPPTTPRRGVSISNAIPVVLRERPHFKCHREYRTCGCRRVRVRGVWVLAIAGRLLGLALHGSLVHPQPRARSQVVGPPAVRMRHVLVVLLRPEGQPLRRRVVRAHKRPDVTALAASHVPFPGHVLVLVRVLGAELRLALHLCRRPKTCCFYKI